MLTIFLKARRVAPLRELNEQLEKQGSPKPSHGRAWKSSAVTFMMGVRARSSPSGCGSSRLREGNRVRRITAWGTLSH